MAKRRMLCPFSRQLCRDCSVYRGRHYALCFSESYRGYLGKPGECAGASRRSSLEAGAKNRPVIPVIRVIRAHRVICGSRANRGVSARRR